MTQIASITDTPYYAVIFTSIRTELNDGYDSTASKMVQLAEQIDGFLGMESARDDVGITVSYWRNLEAIKRWKQHPEHVLAQKGGREKWYQSYSVRIAKVEKHYGF